MNITEAYYQRKIREHLKHEYGTSQWIQVSGHTQIHGADAGFWCGFIPKARIEEALQDFSWDISMSSGYPGFEMSGEGTVYKSNIVDKDEEPLLFYREFYGVASDYVEVSQEFILLNNLRYDRKHKSYFAMYDSGEREEAIKYEDDSTIKIKAKFLKRYAAAKQLAIVLQFDVRTNFSGQLSDYGLTEFRETITDVDLCYSIVGGEYHIPDTVFSRALGKKIIAPEPIEDCGFWPYEREKEYEDFIIGSDQRGNSISYTSNPNCLNNYFGSNPSAPMYLTPVFFSRDVLQKYYDKPDLYSISDGRLSCRSLWSVEIDNHHKDVVSVFLGDLGRDLPEVEQKHWKNYNILTDESISEVTVARDLLCYAAESNVIEHQFKRDYEQLNKQWNEIYGWPLYRKLASDDAYVFDQIRRPLSDGQAEFDHLVLMLCKLIIDCLNEKKLASNTENAEGLKGIGKLEHWIKSNDIIGFEEHISFLKDLWELRSSGSGHAKGKGYKKVSEKFMINELPLPDVFDGLLKKADAYLQFMISNFT